MKKHAGANLEGHVASELRLGGRVGRIQVCVRVVPACVRRVVPACVRRGAVIVNVEVRAENLQRSLPAPGAVAILDEQSTREPQARAAGASCTAI